MEFIKLFLIIILISLFFRTLLKRRIEEVIPFTSLFMIIIIFICGLFNNLSLGVNIIKIITFIAMVFNLFHLKKVIKNKNIKEELKLILTPGFFIYTILFIFFCYLNRNFILEDYDEFNHWGLIIKNMFYYNGYGTVSNSRVTFNEYPPLTANFSYILLKLNNVFLEDRTLIGQNILYLSLIIPITNKINYKKSLKKLILSLVIILFVPMIFYKAFFYNLLVDGLMGILFGIGLYIIYQNDEDKNYKIMSFVLIITSLVLIKNTGLFLAILLIIYYLFDLLFINKEKLKSKEIKKLLLLLLIPLILIISWYIKIYLGKYTVEWKIDNINIEEKVEDKEKVKKLYFQSTYNKKSFTIRNISFIFTLLALIGYSFCIYELCNKKEQKKYFFIMIFHSLTFLIFFIFLLWVYLNLFLNVESIVLSCYERYLSTLLISWLMLNSLILLNKPINLKTIYLFLLFIIFFTPSDNLKNRYIDKENFKTFLQTEKSNYTKISKYQNLITNKDRVYFYSNIANPFVVKINRYEFFNINIINQDGNFKGSKEEFVDLILKNQIDYIYIFKNLPEITDQYLSLFEEQTINEDTLYKVIIDKKNQIKLKKVL